MTWKHHENEMPKRKNSHIKGKINVSNYEDDHDQWLKAEKS